MNLKRFITRKILPQILLMMFGLGSMMAQGPIDLTPEQSASWSGVYKYMNESPNPDSAIVFLRQSAQNLTGPARDLITYQLHHIFANLVVMAYRNDSVSSPEKWKKAGFARDMVNLLAQEKIGPLHQATNGLVTWAKLAEGRNGAATTDLVNTFIHKEIFSQDLYLNRSGRYGVMIYKQLLENPKQQTLAAKLFDALDENLTQNQIVLTEKSSFEDRQKRAWLRYMLASLNFVKGSDEKDLEEKEKYLQKAFHFSPDAMDLSHAGFVVDIPMLHTPDRISFQKDYLDLLVERNASQEKLLPVLLVMSLANPDYKTQLEKTYGLKGGQQKDFASYWLDAVNGIANNTPPMELPLLDNQQFVSRAWTGKWILLDFWGTWCAPCRAEHPDMEKLYTDYVKPKNDQMAIVTIACNDKKEKVAAYMQEKKFTFPVAMSDDQIQETLLITTYPTKLLITPQGKYVRVPNGPKWVEFVKLYTGL